MSFYLLLLLGWCGVAVAAAMLMGRFIAAGRGELGRDDDSLASASPGGTTRKTEAEARRGKREAA
jgi:hypothetical protein